MIRAEPGHLGTAAASSFAPSLVSASDSIIYQLESMACLHINLCTIIRIITDEDWRLTTYILRINS